MDLDRDGLISESDLINSFLMMNLEKNKINISEIMRAIDRDGDGFLTYEDFREILKLEF
jgi:Ca2+-binding EF-hand superfamily protein